MDNLYIQTTQNVAIEHNAASVVERLLASLLDYSFMGTYFMVVFIIASNLKVIDVEGATFVILFLLLPIMLYHLFCEVFMNGQSFGKKIVKLKVVNMEGTSPELGAYLIRWFFRPVEILTWGGVIAILTVIFNGKGQRIGDIAAKTTVVRLKRKMKLGDTIFTELPDGYIPVFPQVALLSERDIYTVKEALNYVTIYKTSNHAIILGYKTKKAIMNALSIESELKPQLFLRTIMRDYNAVNKDVAQEQAAYGFLGG